MKNIKIILIGICTMLPLFSLAQQWSAEQQEVIDVTTAWYDEWQKAFKQKDLNIWFEGFNIDKDYIFWNTINEALPSRWEGNKMAVEKTFWPQVKNEYWEDFRPVAVGIYDDVAVVHFYDYWVIENIKGEITREERKGVWTYVKRNSEWVYVSGIVAR